MPSAVMMVMERMMPVSSVSDEALYICMTSPEMNEEGVSGMQMTGVSWSHDHVRFNQLESYHTFDCGGRHLDTRYSNTRSTKSRQAHGFHHTRERLQEVQRARMRYTQSWQAEEVDVGCSYYLDMTITWRAYDVPTFTAEPQRGKFRCLRQNEL